MFRFQCILLTLLVTVGALAAPASVFIRVKDGQWVKTTGKPGPGAVSVTLPVDQLTGGCADVVVNKPEWMVLDDQEAPRLAWVKLNEVEMKAANIVDLGVINDFPAVLDFGIKDNANPLQASSAVFRLTPTQTGVTVDTSRLGFPTPSGRLRVVVPRLPAGAYTAVLRLADAAPDANTLELTVRFGVTGFSVSEDNQTVSIGTPGGGFVLRSSPQATLSTGSGAAAYLTANIQGQHMYLEKITDIQVLHDTPELKTLRVVGTPGETDKKQDGSKLCRLEYDLSVRAGLPCLLVTSRIINLGPKGGLYCWWGWLPGAGYADSSGRHEWSKAYKTVGKVGWVFLPSEKPSVDNIGWLSPLVFGESRFGSMLLYTDPQTIPDVETGGAV